MKTIICILAFLISSSVFADCLVYDNEVSQLRDRQAGAEDLTKIEVQKLLLADGLERKGYVITVDSHATDKVLTLNAFDKVTIYNEMRTNGDCIEKKKRIKGLTVEIKDAAGKQIEYGWNDTLVNLLPAKFTRFSSLRKGVLKQITTCK